MPDLHSYVIRERIDPEHGMIRVFHNTGDSMACLVGPTGEFNVAPHSHRQDITLVRIAGNALNVDFSIDRLVHGKQQREWVFGSALLGGEFSIEWRNTVDLRVSNVCPIPDAGMHLASDRVHTVIAPPDSAWLVIEGKTAHARQRSLCYSLRGDFQLQSAGLYVPMSESEVAEASALQIFDMLREKEMAS